MALLTWLVAVVMDYNICTCDLHIDGVREKGMEGERKGVRKGGSEERGWKGGREKGRE